MQELTPELRELAIERVVNKMDRGHFWDGWWEFCPEDHYSPAAELLSQLGFDYDTRSRRRMNGTYFDEPCFSIDDSRGEPSEFHFDGDYRFDPYRALMLVGDDDATDGTRKTANALHEAAGVYIRRWGENPQRVWIKASKVRRGDDEYDYGYTYGIPDSLAEDVEDGDAEFDAWVETVQEWEAAVQEAVDFVCGVVMEGIREDWLYCGSDDHVRDHVESNMTDDELWEYVQDEVEQLEEAA